MRKSNKKGFTLVELVVVIAIIGVLAAILIPTMMNYVKKARLKTANSNAKLVFTTVNNKCADIVSDGDVCDGLKASKQDVSAWASSKDKVEKAVYDALKDNGDGIGYVCVNYETKDDAAERRKAAFDRIMKLRKPMPDLDYDKELAEYREEKYGR